MMKTKITNLLIVTFLSISSAFAEKNCNEKNSKMYLPIWDNMVLMQQLGVVSNPENVALIDALYKAFAVGDISKVLAGLDEKIVWNEAEGNKYADGNPYIGPQAVLNGVFARIGAEYEYFKLADIQLHEMANNKVLATLRYQAKLKKNGATYDAQVAHLWTLKDGKAVAFQQYLDTKKVNDAINK
jgi:uncharacterized protein